jgi:hypothetical protein
MLFPSKLILLSSGQCSNAAHLRDFREDFRKEHFVLSVKFRY